MITTSVRKILSVSSPAFENDAMIPIEFTCEGAGISPALSIQGIPENTSTLAIIMEDPDAPGGVYDHWLVWNIPPTDTIPANAIPGLEGKNSAGKFGYVPPCPPTGTHRYYIKVFAVDTILETEKGADKHKLLYVLQNHVLAYGELVGLYKRQLVKTK